MYLNYNNHNFTSYLIVFAEVHMKVQWFIRVKYRATYTVSKDVCNTVTLIISHFAWI